VNGQVKHTIDTAYPAMSWGGWFGLTPDDHILMIVALENLEMSERDPFILLS
jgi:hypothetical protein